MKHLNEEQLTMAYYGDADEDARAHLDGCAECRATLQRIERLLNEIREYPVPERGEEWESELWTRIAPQLQQPRKFRIERFRWWMWAPALAAMLALAFFAGMLTQGQKARGLSAESRERVLLIAMGDHLDRSEMVVAELVNATPATADLQEERARARDLLGENRLLRQTAARSGDAQHAAVLDELERVLLDIAHTPADASPDDLEALQRRIEREGLLFKMRIISTNIREKGRSL